MSLGRKLYAGLLVLTVLVLLYAIFGPKAYKLFAFLATGVMASIGVVIFLISVAIGKPLDSLPDNQGSDDDDPPHH